MAGATQATTTKAATDFMLICKEKRLRVESRDKERVRASEAREMVVVERKRARQRSGYLTEGSHAEAHLIFADHVLRAFVSPGLEPVLGAAAFTPYGICATVGVAYGSSSNQ